MAGYSVEKALEDRKKRIKEEEYNARYREALKDPEGYANKNKPISVEDALKERKKSLSENSGSIKNDIARRYNSVLSSYKSYANNYSDSLYGEGSVKKTLDKQRSTRKETASLVSDIKAYRKIIGEKKADDMIKNLDSMKGVYDYAYEAAKVYTNFKSEEDYKKAVENAEKQKEMLSFDLDAGKKEIDSLDGIVSKISELENQKGKNSTTDY